MNNYLNVMSAYVFCICIAQISLIGMAGTVAGRETNVVTRVFRPERYLRGNTGVLRVQPIDDADWIDLPERFRPSDPVRFTRFSKEFDASGEDLIVDVSADERFDFRVDGVPVAQGPHRGMPGHWYYQSYRLALNRGRHRLDCTVWSLGKEGPSAQLSEGRHGFVLKASGCYDDVLTTGKSKWRSAAVMTTRMDGKGNSGTHGVGSQYVIRGASPQTIDGLDWHDAVVVEKRLSLSNSVGVVNGRALFPSAIADPVVKLFTEGRFVDASGMPLSDSFQRLSRRVSFSVPANARSTVYWDLEDYRCAYPELRVSGGKGAVVTWGWTESLTDDNGKKGVRNECKGKYFTRGMTDRFLCDGRNGACFSTPWWRAGRWCQLTVETADEPLTMNGISMRETYYPIEERAVFSCSDATLEALSKICRRSLQMCSHEMFMDCPYYEQQMYPGDARVQMQVFSSLASDDRLIRQSAQIFGFAQRDDGLVPMDWPSSHDKVSATFTLAWSLVLYDYLMYHNNIEWAKSQLPAVRRAFDGLALYEGPDGLLDCLPGWSFMDWAGWWKSGIGPSGVVNLFYLYALQRFADTERMIGNDCRKEELEHKILHMRDALRNVLWDAACGMVADTVDHKTFSEHAQALGILTGVVPSDEVIRVMENIDKDHVKPHATVYFSHYVFEACFQAHRPDVFMKKLGPWRQQVSWGLSTAMETSDKESRSDCHGWSSHPLYYFLTGLAGIQPSSPGFSSVRIRPQPGSLRFIKASVPHRLGDIAVDLVFTGKDVSGTVELPEGLSGEFEWSGRSLALPSGKTKIDN